MDLSEINGVSIGNKRYGFVGNKRRDACRLAGDLRSIRRVRTVGRTLCACARACVQVLRCSCRAGLIAVAPSYRLGCHPHHMHDVVRALEWVRSSPALAVSRRASVQSPEYRSTYNPHVQRTCSAAGARLCLGVLRGLCWRVMFIRRCKAIYCHSCMRACSSPSILFRAARPAWLPLGATQPDASFAYK
jgi:predicted CxxxxCH...CXXCH cytochrome family protein